MCLSDSRAFHTLLFEPTVFPNVSDCLFAWPTVFGPAIYWLWLSPRLPRAPMGQFAKPVALKVGMPNLTDHFWCLRFFDRDLVAVAPWRRQLWLGPCDTQRNILCVEVFMARQRTNHDASNMHNWCQLPRRNRETKTPNVRGCVQETQPSTTTKTTILRVNTHNPAYEYSC